MVHLGLPVNLDLLQQLLFRAPRQNLSPGIVADLTAALKKLEDLDPQHWEAQVSGQQQQQRRRRGLRAGEGRQEQPQWRARWERLEARWARRQRQQLVASVGRAAAAASEEGAELDLDALIDSARDELGAVLGLGQNRQKEEDGFVPLATVPSTASAEEELQQLDADTQQRVSRRLAIAQELVDDSMGVEP
jgi:hypothetical protein